MKKNSFLRRGLALLLAFVLAAGYLVPAQATERSSGLKLGIEQIGNDAVSAAGNPAQEMRAEQTEPDMSQLVRVSIQLEKASTMDAGFALKGIAADAAAMNYRDSLRREQENVIASIERRVLGGRELDVVWNLTLGANVISANVPRGAIARIEKLDGVRCVTEETRYEPQTASVAGTYEPHMAISGQMTGAQQAWLAGYTGAGTTIAIIDTGLDTDHQSFNANAYAYAMEESGKTAGMDVQDIEAVLTELNAYRRQAEAGAALTAEDLYINDKAAFGYNYIDGSLDVTHDNDTQGSHGSHVAGIAAANRFVAAEDGYADALQETGVAGNAPDAQLLVMKVFGTNGGAYDSDIMAAMEDAVILGADSINLSLGSAVAGRTYSDDPLFEALFRKLEQTDTVVAISSGNSGNWAENTYYGHLFSDDVNFATNGTPGTYTNSLAVASAENDGDFSGSLTVGSHTFGYMENLDDGYTAYGNTPLTALDTSANADGTDYEFVYIDGYGLTADYDGIDLTGKVVFVPRGEISFLDKAHNAAALGAAAVIVCNNEPGVIYMDLTGLQNALSVVSITQGNAAQVKAAASAQTTEAGTVYYTGTVTVVGTVSGNYNDSEYKVMSSFSSWGVPGELVLKPEITAPGGNIYSVNGVDPSGTAYELMFGTSMAAPQVAGMSALLLQYLQENGIHADGMTDRALAQSLLMSTAEAMLDGTTGNYYPVIQQGSGLANVSSAMNTPVYITVEGQSDGKVKAELGDDPARTGVYSFDFSLNNLSDEAVAYRLSAELFTQDVFEEEGVRLLDTLTRTMDADVQFSVGGQVLAAAQDLTGCDFNGDGAVDRADAQALLNHVTAGADLTADAQNADLSGDGLVNTYDVHLLLKGLGSAVTVDAGSSVTVEVTLRLTDEEKARLNEENPAGAYVEAFVTAEPAATAEGEALPVLSIPVLGFYGGWHEPSMFDETCYTTYFTGEEDRESYWATSYVNGVGVSYGDNENVTYYFGGNPVTADSKYMPERNAINLERGDYFRGWDFGLIRNAGAHRARVVNTTTGEELFCEEGGAVDAAYYYAALGGWLNVPQTFELDFAPDMAEGERGELSFSAVVDRYAGDWSKADTMQMPFIVDNTAPVIDGDSVEVDTEKNVLRLTVSDNQHVAGVVLYDVTGRKRLALCGADQEAPAGSTVTLEVPLDQVDGYKFVIQVVDYAVNKATYKLTETIGDPAPMPEMLYFSPTFGEWTIGDWPETTSELVSYDGWFESETDVLAATAVGSYIYFMDSSNALYAAPGDNLYEYAKVCTLEHPLADMTYDRENGIIYAIYSVDNYDSMLISIDRMTGAVTEIGKLAAGYYPAATLAYAGGGQFYITSDSTSPNLYTFTLSEGQIGSVSLVGYVNPYSSGYDCLEYNPNDGMLYLVCNNAYSETTQAYELNKIDPADPTSGSYVKSDYRYFYGEVSSLIFPDWSDEANAWFDPSGEVSAVTLNKNEAELFEGKTLQLKAGVSPWYTEDRAVIFTSSDPAVADVTADGLVTGISEGTAVITAASAADPEIYDQCTVTVSVLDITVEGILVRDSGSGDVTSFFSWDAASGEDWTAGAELAQDAIAAAPIPGSDRFFLLNPGFATYEMDGAGQVVSGPYSYMPDSFYYPHGLACSSLYSTEDTPWVYYIRNGSLMRPRSVDSTDPVVTFSMGYDHDDLIAVTSAGTEPYTYYGAEYDSDVIYLLDDTGMVWRANIFTYYGSCIFKYSRLPSTLPEDLFADKSYSSMVLGDDGALYLSAFTGRSSKLYRLAYNADDGCYDAMDLGDFGENVWPAIVMKVTSNADAVTAVPEATMEAVLEEQALAPAAGGTQSVSVGSQDAMADGSGIRTDCAEMTVTVPVYAADSTNGLLELRYDAQLLTFDHAELGALLTCVVPGADGVIRIGYADGAAVNGPIAELVFTVNTRQTCQTELVLTTLEDCALTEISEQTAALEIPGHSYVSVVTPPTDTERGYTTHTCAHCGHSYVDSYVEIVLASGWSGYTTWVLTSDGTLTFTPSEQTLDGETNMKNYWKVHGVLTLPWTPYAEQITKVVIEEGIHDIGQMAFYELPNLTEVVLPESAVEIRGYAFKNCKNLTTINLEVVEFIREGAFYGCSALEDLTFADDVVIEDWAFYRTSVTLP